MGVVICSYDGRIYGWDNIIEFGHYGWEREGKPYWTIDSRHSIHISKDKSSTDVLLNEILPKLKKKYRVGKSWRTTLGVCIHLPFARKIDNVKETVESILEELEEERY